MDLVGTVICNRYKILQRIGAGGMGTVYLAEHSYLGRTTALKILRRELGVQPHAEERFRREAMLAARIDHPAVAQIYDFDRTGDGEFVLAMEYVEGETVGTRLRRDGRFPIRLCVKVLQDVAGGLDRAHAFKILHRDLKPENIMLAKHGMVKLLDFGVARDIEAATSITSSGFAVGTPAYMSPEQLTADVLGPPTDIYSLGVVVYEMLSGRIPHDGANIDELRVQRLTRPAAALDRLRDDCPAMLASVVARALDVTPENRWPSASAFADAAAACLEEPSSSIVVPVVSRPGADQLDRWEAHFEALRFAGREREVRLVRDAWTAARAGRTTVLYIEGEEGAGKSAFFELARRDAGADGAAQLVGRGYDVDVARPYGPWHAILREALTLRAAGERGWSAVTALTDATAATPVPERVRLFEEVGALIRAGGSEELLFVGLEDLESCDPASGALFEFLARDVNGAPVLLVATADTGHGAQTATVRDVRERLRALRNVVSVSLRPLGYDAVHGWFATALGHEPPEALVRYVYGHTEGNAFFVEQVVRSLVEQENLDDASDDQLHLLLSRQPAPRAVAEVVHRRLERLSAAAREVTQIASVIGREFDVDLLLELTRRGEESVLDALDEAEAAGVLAPMRRPDGDWYRFDHVQIADVLADGINQRRRRQLHARIASALEERAGSPAVVLAGHWYEAGEHARASAHALRAAERALRVHDYDDAISAAVMAADAAEAGEDRCRAHELRGDALRRMDRHPEAAAAYARAQLDAATDEVRRRLRCRELRSALIAGSIEGSAAVEELVAIGCGPDVALPTTIASLAQLTLAEAQLAAGAFAEAATTAERCAVSADAVGNTYRRGDAELVQGTAQLRAGRLNAATEAATGATVIFRRLGDAYGIARAALLRSAIAAAAGDRDEASAALDEARHHAERAGVTRLVRLIGERRASV